MRVGTPVIEDGNTAPVDALLLTGGTKPAVGVYEMENPEAEAIEGDDVGTAEARVLLDEMEKVETGERRAVTVGSITV